MTTRNVPRLSIGVTNDHLVMITAASSETGDLYWDMQLGVDTLDWFIDELERARAAIAPFHSCSRCAIRFVDGTPLYRVKNAFGVQDKFVCKTCVETASKDEPKA